MNPGYLALLLSCITLILLSSGWKRVLLGGISKRAIVSFFMVWLPASFVHVRLGRWEANLSFAVFALISAAGLFATRRMAERLHMLACGLLLGSVYFLTAELLRVSPALSFYKPEELCLVLVVGLGVLLQRGCLPQLIIVNTALLAGHLMTVWAHPSHRVVGGPGFQDQWWQALLAVRIVTISVEHGTAACRRLLVIVNERRRDGWK